MRLYECEKCADTYSTYESARHKNIISNPGQLTSNINVGTSVMRAPYFEMFSFVDERSVAYLACGLAAESGEPVALSRSGVTAHRRCKAERPGSDNTRRRTVHGG